MNDFLKQVIEEKFASKKQQRYFYAKANDKTLSKKEREKWSKMAGEFSDKTNFKKLPDAAEKEEQDMEEIVDDHGNIQRSNIPIDVNKEFETSKSTTDKVVQTSYGAQGRNGLFGTARTNLRYWGESDMSKALGYDDTLGDDESYKQALHHFTKTLGLSHEEAVKRLEDMGYIPGQNELVRLVENPKKYMEDYIETVLSKKTYDSDLIDNTEEEPLNPIVQKQIDSLLKTIEKKNIPLAKVINKLKK